MAAHRTPLYAAHTRTAKTPTKNAVEPRKPKIISTQSLNVWKCYWGAGFSWQRKIASGAVRLVPMIWNVFDGIDYPSVGMHMVAVVIGD